MGGIQFLDKIMLYLSMSVKRPALGLDPMGGNRFLDKIMLN
jgi:hypothetical protein